MTAKTLPLILVLLAAGCAAPKGERVANDPPVVAAPSALPASPPPSTPAPPSDVAAPLPTPAAPAKADERRFSGTVTKVDTGCFADAVCFMEIDGKRVVFGRGWSREDWGQVAQREPVESYVGRKVEVFCQQRDGECTLAGNKDYYIR